MPTINGGAGNDNLSGSPINDIINGLGGNDQITDDFGNDKLDGGTGNDHLIGNTGDDTIIGGAGNDSLFGGLDKDSLIGGAGNDYYWLVDTIDIVVEAIGGGTDTIATETINNLSLANYANVEVLALSGTSDLNGSGSDRSDQIIGNGAENLLTGGKGNDTLAGNGGVDTLIGGVGNDTFYVDNAADVLDELAGEGKDTVVAFADYILGASVEIEILTLGETSGDSDGTGNKFANTINGNAFDNSLSGLGGNDSLNGGAGNDALNGGIGNDAMNGGKGNDLYFVDNAGDKVTEVAGQGDDKVMVGVANYTLTANVEEGWVTAGGLNIVGNTLANLLIGGMGSNKLDGAGGNDIINGGSGSDTVIGAAGNDKLDGDSGDDTMIGGAGNDIYDVDSLNDVVTELAGSGTDTVLASIGSLILAAQVENLTLLGSSDISGTGNTLSNVVTGNDGKNFLVGDNGNDTLDGGAKADVLVGGLGNDIYYVDDAGDQIQESAGQGKDTVFASATYVLAIGQEIESLTLTGSGDISGTGNGLSNVIIGNAGANGLQGLGSNDTLIGGDGNDILDGGAGKDSMNGGKGSDWYFVDDAGDKVTEAAGQGDDTVFSNAASYTLAANVETLLFLAAAVNGTGNTLGNLISGNTLANKLDGGGGNDDLKGHDGIDTLIGGAGNDTLDGGSGADSMVGGAGNDYFIVDDFSDVVSEAAGGGTFDRVQTALNGLILTANVENLGLLGTGNISGTGNDLSNNIWGNDGNNVLIGGKGNDTLTGFGGADTLKGGVGNDTYVIVSGGDIVEEKAGEGYDTVSCRGSFSFNDSLEIEKVILSGVGTVVSTGNSFANTIIMTSEADADLNGNGGHDTLTGGAGDDTILGAVGNDVIDGGAGNDDLLGGADNDKLTGGEGNDTLQGGAGKDAMAGGKGDDSYVVLEVGDTVTELAGQGYDTVRSSITSYTLTANVEQLTLEVGAVNGTGNTGNNRLNGNDADNKLDGGSGNDALFGGAGKDSLLGGLGNDFLSGAIGDDSLKGGGGNDLLIGGAGADVMWGEAGADGFLYRLGLFDNINTLGGDTINGFQTGVDKIELTDLLDDFGINPANAFSGGYVILTKVGTDTLVQFDKDGGANSVLTLATVTNANVAASDLMLDATFVIT
jgi:Ca2+-binding RTX toxin-like protein